VLKLDFMDSDERYLIVIIVLSVSLARLGAVE